MWEGMRYYKNPQDLKERNPEQVKKIKNKNLQLRPVQRDTEGVYTFEFSVMSSAKGERMKGKGNL